MNDFIIFRSFELYILENKLNMISYLKPCLQILVAEDSITKAAWKNLPSIKVKNEKGIRIEKS